MSHTPGAVSTMRSVPPWHVASRLDDGSRK